MSAANLLAECLALDIHLRAHRGQLDIDAPEELLTDELLQRLREAKPELLMILATPAPSSTTDLDLQQVFPVAIDSPAATADFCLLLTEDDLPTVPFRLNPWTEVRDASKMLRCLRSDILSGLSGPWTQLAALQADLLALKQFALHWAENKPMATRQRARAAEDLRLENANRLWRGGAE